MESECSAINNRRNNNGDDGDAVDIFSNIAVRHFLCLLSCETYMCHLVVFINVVTDQNCSFSSLSARYVLYSVR